MNDDDPYGVERAHKIFEWTLTTIFIIFIIAVATEFI